MERTKETLEARVRETPLVDRLKECQKRIGNMCAELRGPKMSIPVEHYDDDFYICTTLADAQATVDALQARVQELEARQHFGACAKCLTNAWRICKEGTPDAVEMKCSNGSTWWLCDYCLSKEQLTQRTAEVTQLQALVRALPVRVTEVQVCQLAYGWRVLWEGGFSGDFHVEAHAKAYAKLLEYRASLDATTPAPDTSIIGKCEPPSQWAPNAQVRGDIS